MTSTPVFNDYSRYYDLLYQDKDYVGETDYVQALLSRYGITQGSLLEFGSGTGKHGCLLAERGYNVTGIERSPSMVALVPRVDGFNCQVGDICTVQLGRTFDAVLSLFHVVSYQVTNEAIQALFSRAAEHLESGGLFVFDVWYSPAVYAQHPEIRVKRLADETIEITRVAEPIIFPNENRVDVHYTVFASDVVTGGFSTFTEIHPMRHFSIPEIDNLATMCGFQQINAEAFLTGEEPGENTWGVCFVLRKKY
ncbi:MAG: class I SAM-dependent DNA methyltransferase [Chlorobium sp.]